MTKVKKFITICVLIVLLGTCGILTKPKPAQAFDFAQLARNIWDWAEGPIVATLAGAYLQVIRPYEMAWIAGQSDRPVMPTDWGEYLADTASAYILDNISQKYLKGLNLCGDIPTLLSISLAPMAIPPAKVPLVPPCTAREAWENIKEGVANLDDFVKIAEPQNNFFGGYLIAHTELGKRVAKKETEIRSKLIAGQGYLGIQKCEEVQGPLAPGETREEVCRTVSPGSLISQKVGWSSEIPVKTIAEATEISKLIQGIIMDQADVAMGGMINRLYQAQMSYYREKK